MGTKRKTYITEPQRIYEDPLHPQTSYYDVVIPKTSSDAVYIEKTGSTLSDFLEDISGTQLDTRNTIIRGEDILKIENNKFLVGNYVITVSDGFTDKGLFQDVVLKSEEYVELPNPSSDDAYLIIKYDGSFEYCKSFNGGRNFPLNAIDGDIFYNNQLRKSFKFNGSEWESYPCTAIATFERGLLTGILPYNTWWWDEVVWENTEPDIPCGMNLSVFTDKDGTDYLAINKGGVIDTGHYFELKTPIYKDVTLNFESGSYKGSGDGNYSSTQFNIIPTDITRDNLQGFSITATNNFDGVFSSFNPNISSSIGGWTTSDYPASFTVAFPFKKSINKYTIMGWYDTDIDKMARSWDLFGSNDGENWEMVHSVANSIFSYKGEIREFSTNTTKMFSFIRFVVRGNTSGATQSCCVGQIRFYTSIPELGVFAITDDNGKTDIITSPYSGPTMPDDYTYYHRIGTVSVNTDGKIIDLFPKTTFGVDIASKYASIREDVSKKVDSDLKNLNLTALKRISNSVAPRTSADYADTTLIVGTVYKAPCAGYIYVFDQSNSVAIYNHSNQSNVSGQTLNALVASSNANCMCSAFVSEGSFYKVTGVRSANSIIKFIPTIGASL